MAGPDKQRPTPDEALAETLNPYVNETKPDGQPLHPGMRALVVQLGVAFTRARQDMKPKIELTHSSSDRPLTTEHPNSTGLGEALIALGQPELVLFIRKLTSEPVPVTHPPAGRRNISGYGASGYQQRRIG